MHRLSCIRLDTIWRLIGNCVSVVSPIGAAVDGNSRTLKIPVYQRSQSREGEAAGRGGVQELATLGILKFHFGPD